MIVIASAAYVGQEFQVELGRIPPAMLPVGNCRLFERQVNALLEQFPREPIFLSLPEKYDLCRKDKFIIDSYNIGLVLVPENISLSDSLLYVINSVGQYDTTLRLLHGDTLVTEIPDGQDLLALAKTHDDYNWEVERRDNSEELVWCGYFSFSNVKLLAKCLASARGDFVRAVRQYDTESPLARTEIDGWYDLGHVNSYFKSRSKITTQRDFNTITVSDGCVTKTGLPANKIRAEGLWFNSLPKQLKLHSPQLIEYGEKDGGEPFYVLEYLCISPLNELYVHGHNPPFFWTKVFGRCEAYLNKCMLAADEIVEPNFLDDIEADARELIVDKTKERLVTYAAESGVDIDKPTSINGRALPSLGNIADECIKAALLEAPVTGIMHGDFCFSNILLDTRSDVLKVIDPRGLNMKGEFCLLGDLRYDLAKLNHSVLGLYDFIIAGAYECNHRDNIDFEFEIFVGSRIENIQKEYEKRTMLLNIKAVEVMPLTILLFLSMLPLHADKPDRQSAFIANALRLYRDYMLTGN